MKPAGSLSQAEKPDGWRQTELRFRDASGR